MSDPILILAPKSDDHAALVAGELSRRGFACDWLCGEDFPVRDRLDLRIGAEGVDCILETPDGTRNISDYATVWRRRGEGVEIDAPALDPRDRTFAQNEATAAADGWRDVSALSGTRWVNPRAAAARADANKPLQLAIASRMGLSVPDTLISNSPEAIAAFHGAHHGRIIYKPLTPALFREAEGDMVSFVNLLPPDALEEPDVLALAPGIYQPLVKKAYELRVNVFGDRVIATRIANQHVEGGRIDWRSKVHLTNLDFVELPAQVEAALLRFMSEMGLVFGAVDFVVTPEGEHLFLEVNQMGQFLWIDSLTGGRRLLDAMCDFLGQADTVTEAANRSLVTA